MKFIYSIALVALCLAGAQAADTAAQAKCRSLHHVDVDAGTAYANSQCLLNCIIHGASTVHDMNEGLACPTASSGICQHGQCVQAAKLGHIDIEVVSASLSTRANAYATVCIQNSTTPLTLPIQNRASCVSCSSNVVPSTTLPTWHSVCAGSGKYLFVSDARVSFEVWDNHGEGAANKIFLGGASVTIPQLLSHGDNHKQLHLALTGGHTAGQVNAIVTWTPK